MPPPDGSLRLRQTHPTGLGWLLGAFAASLPWLIPVRTPPWATFYNEIAMAFALWPLAVWALWAGRGKTWPLDGLTLGVVATMLVPLGQAAAGLLWLPGEAVYAVLYLAGFALTLSMAREAQDLAPRRLIDLLFAGLAIAALASAGIALAQWFRLDSPAGLLDLSTLHLHRSSGNIGQPNNLATLLVWGLVALWWAHQRGVLGGVVATSAAALLLVGVALTGSRAGALELGLLALAAWRWRHLLGTDSQRRVWAALAVWFVLVLLTIPSLARFLELDSVRQLNESASPRERLNLLRMMLAAIAERPWTGWGWNQVLSAHAALSDRFALHVSVGNAHNLVLDLLVWFGIPLGGLVAVGLLAWFWRIDRRIANAEQALIYTALAVFLLHAMLELPHMLAYFQLPVAVMLGTLSAMQASPTLVRLPRTAVGVFVLALGALLPMLFAEYQRVEANALAARVRAANILGAPEEYDPNVTLLRPLQTSLLAVRQEPHRGMSHEELEGIRRVLMRYPSPAGLWRYAQAAALNGEPDQVRWAVGVACSLDSIKHCQASARAWKELAATQFPEMASIALPVPTETPNH